MTRRVRWAAALAGLWVAFGFTWGFDQPEPHGAVLHVDPAMLVPPESVPDDPAVFVPLTGTEHAGPR